jgi:hypothetical protein
MEFFLACAQKGLPTARQRQGGRSSQDWDLPLWKDSMLFNIQFLGFGFYRQQLRQREDEDATQAGDESPQALNWI